MKNYRIPQLADKYTNFDMIRTYTTLPPLANPRLCLLQAVLDEGGTELQKSELFALATALVQLAMDTHDEISAQYEDQRLEKDMRSTQLKVLAGDYFSARFYYLLAKQGEIALIAKLSGAVSEVNQLKMDLYFNSQEQVMTVEDYITTVVEIKSRLFLQFSDLLTGLTANLWPEIIRTISKLEIITGEYERMNQLDSFQDSLIYWHLLEQMDSSDKQAILAQVNESKLMQWIEQYQIKLWLEQLLEETCNQVERLCTELGAVKIVSHLQFLTEKLCSKTNGIQVAVQ
ncbi:heptaprenyl diphosphate synthase component 1 [Paenibacillus yanchengensis]|uniref:Heptaprenyl diphosphate synthase component 1 n=1 Tax=Paenibacillus yanchengensis TaxID=2035833 RepID=A0ABW4YK07_9BACL